MHDDTKNGYAAGHMPCGAFGANAATTHGRYLTARIADWVVRPSGLLALRSVLRRLRRAARHAVLPVPAG